MFNCQLGRSGDQSGSEQKLDDIIHVQSSLYMDPCRNLC